MTDKEKIDFAAIEVPKTLRLNQPQRANIANHMATYAYEKAHEDRDTDGEAAKLTSKLYDHFWEDSKTLEAAKKLPAGFFPELRQTRLVIVTTETRQIGLTEKDVTSFVRVRRYSALNFKDENSKETSLLMPHKAGGEFFVFEKRTPEIENYIKNAHRASDLENDELAQKLFDFVTFSDRAQEAKEELNRQALSALKQIRSVRELQKQWPAAFEVYHFYYSQNIEGEANALVASVPISNVSKMIEDFPDFADTL